jgi:hypothetical protein
MRIPAKRIRFERTWDGRTEGEGFLVIDIKGLDIEGANTFVLTIEELDAARKQSGHQSEVRDRLKGLFGE